MSTFQDQELECPKCGNNSGVYELDCFIQEEWFRCLHCNWGYQTIARRFAQDTLHQLKKLVRDKPWSEVELQIERILAVLLSECKAHGRDQGDDAVIKLEDVLKRSISQWQDSDWSVIRELSECRAMFELENGKVAFDYIESPPEIVRVPQSAIRPITELPGLRLVKSHKSRQ